MIINSSGLSLLFQNDKLNNMISEFALTNIEHICQNYDAIKDEYTFVKYAYYNIDQSLENYIFTILQSLPDNLATLEFMFAWMCELVLKNGYHSHIYTNFDWFIDICQSHYVKFPDIVSKAYHYDIALNNCIESKLSSGNKHLIERLNYFKIWSRTSTFGILYTNKIEYKDLNIEHVKELSKFYKELYENLERYKPQPLNYLGKDYTGRMPLDYFLSDYQWNYPQDKLKYGVKWMYDTYMESDKNDPEGLLFKDCMGALIKAINPDNNEAFYDEFIYHLSKYDEFNKFINYAHDAKRIFMNNKKTIKNQRLKYSYNKLINIDDRT